MESNQKQIPVFRTTIVVDACDQHIVDKHTWYISNGYIRSSDGTPLHCHILGNYIGVADHKDGDRLNNSRDNIRTVTYQQNAWNSGMKSNNTTGYKGVYLDKRAKRNKFLAHISSNGVRKEIGHYPTARDAAVAYNEAAVKYHGEFARLNEV